eukprot:c24750_g1_i1 orf=688-1737(-)
MAARSMHPSLLPGLPDDLALQCLLRVSRRSHSSLRSVCRGWRDLLSSSAFFRARLKQNLAQEWLYILLRTSQGQYKWFAFDEESQLWSPLPQLPCIAIGAACAVVDGRLFMMGGSLGESASKNVWAYDARFNRWEMMAPMKVCREFAAAGVIGGRIYVLGGCSTASSTGASAWAEVYDPLVNCWVSIPSPPERRDKWMHGNAVLDGKLLAVADRGGIVLDPSSFSWHSISANLDSGWKGRAAVVKNTLFSCNYLGKILGYDSEEDKWSEVQGWQKDLPKMVSCAMLTNVSEKLYVSWEMPRRGWDTELVLAALDICKESGILHGKVLWWRVISCDMLVGAIIQSLSLAL